MQVRTYVGTDLVVAVEIILPKMDDLMANEILSIIDQEYRIEQHPNNTSFIEHFDSIYEVESFIQEIVLGLKTYQRKKDYIDIHLNRIIETYSN